MTSPSTSSAHTPGPWRISESENEDVYNGQNHIVVLAAIKNGGQIIADIETANDQANAQLIAAAPELLEACKEVLDSSIDFAAYEREYKILIDAIAKAEGRTYLYPSPNLE